MKTCNQCELEPGTVAYVGGTFKDKWISPYYRCEGCNKSFQETLFLERKAAAVERADRLSAHICGQDECDDCQKCCEHEFDSSEGYTCLNCGKEGLEDIMSAAHEQAEYMR